MPERSGLALTTEGSPRIAYGDSSADGLKYAARSGSSWKKRKVQGGRVRHVALHIDYTPDPWNGLQPANAPSIAYVVDHKGTYRAGKGGSGVAGSWGSRSSAATSRHPISRASPTSTS